MVSAACLADERFLLANPAALYPTRFRNTPRVVPTLPHPTMAKDGFIPASLKTCIWTC
jgi:hypothetical protein